MVIDDQSEVLAYLSQPATYGVDAVERLETHASVVFLAGAHAFKLKRAVRYDYLDYSTCERRRRMCEAELRLNRCTAPSLYECLIPVTEEADGSLALAGRGPAVDWLVRMKRFDQEVLFDRLAAREALPPGLMAQLGATLARWHQRAVPRPDHGGLAGMSDVVEGNARSFGEARDILDPLAARRLVTTQRMALLHHGPRLESRRRQGLVRRCHGDLHLRNLVLLDGEPTLFDGIEFNDDLACIDVLYDFAFLLMDLWRRGLQTHANAAWNAYLTTTTDFSGLPLLPLFLSCRAAIRAKTSLATAALTGDERLRRTSEQLAREYLALADAFLAPPSPRVLAIGGLSGAGKSAVAQAVAASLGGAPGAVVMRSDLLRKWLKGVPATTRLSPDAYTPDEAHRVYGALLERAHIVLDAGYAVVADAVFGQPAQRAAIGAAAAAAGVPFTGVWLEAPPDVLAARVAARTGDASDADPIVVARQVRDIPAPVEWPRVDASRPLDQVVADVLACARASAPVCTVVESWDHRDPVVAHAPSKERTDGRTH